MKNSFVFALVIFCILLIVPTTALSYFETRMAPAEAKTLPAEDTSQTEPAKRVSQQIKIKQGNITEPELIKVYNLKTNSVMVLDFEEYVKGVVSSEMPADFNEEALKAQAVTARTYTLYRLKKYPNGQSEHTDAPLCTGIHCQAWASKDELVASHPEGWYENYWGKISDAVDSTRGQILTYDNKIIEPLFHSTSGGRTENSEDVFTAAVPYLRSVDSIYEEEAPKLHASVKIPVTDFITKIKSVYGNLNITAENLKDKIKLGEISEGGKVKSVEIDGVDISGREMREMFSLNSANFSFIQNGNELEIVTTGYGHGVGMSQWGADGMAGKGYNYKEILRHYYTGVDIAVMKLN